MTTQAIGSFGLTREGSGSRRLTGFGPWRFKETIFWLGLAALVRGFAFMALDHSTVVGLGLFSAANFLILLALVQFIDRQSGTGDGEAGPVKPRLFALLRASLPGVLAAGAIGLLFALAGNQTALMTTLDGILLAVDGLAFAQAGVAPQAGAAALAVTAAIALGATPKPSWSLRSAAAIAAAVAAGTAVLLFAGACQAFFRPALTAVLVNSGGALGSTIYFLIVLGFSTLRLMALVGGAILVYCSIARRSS